MITRLTRPVVVSVLLAALCAAVAATSVGDVERLRYRVVTSPRVPDGAELSLPLPDLARFGGQPSALILRLRGAEAPMSVNVQLDGTPVAQVSVPGGRQVRFDTSLLPPAGPGHRMTFAGDRPGWALTYLEIATVHGHSSGFVSFALAPSARAGRTPRMVVILFVVVFVALLAVRRRPEWPSSRWGRYVFHGAVAFVCLLFLLTLVSAVLTRYKVMLTVSTFLISVVVLYANAEIWARLLRGVRTPAGFPRELPPLPSTRELALATSAFVLLIGIVLHVQVRALGSVSDLGDPLFSMWRIAWVLHQLGADPQHLFDANIFYPARGTLTYSDAIILPALMTAPLGWIGLHPVVAYNLLLLSAFVLCGLATYVFARGIGMGVPAAWTSGAIFALYPFRIDHYSHLELQMAFWMPLALLATYRLMVTGRARHIVIGALLIGAQWYSSMYYALFLSVYIAGFALLLAVAWRQWRRLGYAALMVVIAAGLALPLARAYAAWQHERGERPIGAVVQFSATPEDYLQPMRRSAWYGEFEWEQRRGERELFPGIAPVALAVAGAWPPLTATKLALLVSGWVAFDGSLGMNGFWYPLAYDGLFVFRSLRAPARFAILVGLTLALLSGWAVERWSRRARRVPAALWIALMTGIVVVDAWPRLELVPVWREPPGIYASLGASSGAVLLEYPIHPNPDWFEQNIPFLYFSIWHMTPMVNGYSGTLTLPYQLTARALAGFPGGDTIPYLKHLGVTHITVNCAIDGPFGKFLVPEPDPAKCARTIEQLDADTRLRRVLSTSWQGHPALLYELAR